MESLEGKVVGISWQDIWWSYEDQHLDEPWQDEKYIHFTYGLVLRDDDEWISITHEWRPQKLTHCGTTSIPKVTIRNVRVYGDGELETTSEEGAGGSGAAPAGRSNAAKPAASARATGPRNNRSGRGRSTKRAAN